MDKLTIQEALALAGRYFGAGQLQQAKEIYQRVLEVLPAHPEIVHLLGLIAYQEGKLEQTIEYMESAIRFDAAQAKFHNNLGEVYRSAGRNREAADCYRRAIELDPTTAESHNNLGIIWESDGNLVEAVACYQRAVELRPDFVAAHFNLGNTRQAQGKLEEAIACHRRALELKPDYAEAYNSLGIAWEAQGNLDEAIACYRRAFELKPDHVESRNNLGSAWKEQGRLDEAIECFRQALALRPDFSVTHHNLARALGDQGKLDEAVTCYDRAVALAPSNSLRCERAIVLPAVYQSAEEIDAARSRLAAEVQTLHREGVRLDSTKDSVVTPFHLAYQGRNDRDIQEALGRFWYDPVPRRALARTPRADGRIRIGFLSSFFKNHTIGWLWGGVLAELSREKFRVTVFSLGRFDDPAAQVIRQSAEHFVELPRVAVAAQKRVEQEELDVLYYPDVGMDPITTMLAACRLAPVQCASWGHPVTTGLPSMDYFISSDLLETEVAEKHYTEKLVRLKTLGLYLYRPQLPEPAKSRPDFGLPENRHLYACLQSEFKLHPDFDPILGEILRRDPCGELLLLAPLVAARRPQLERRFARTIPDVLNRIRFLPRLSVEDFLRLNALVDVSLDPLHFGGGRTSCEAFALGLPVVTLPSPFLRGRITYALYRIMEMTDCVAQTAEQYVQTTLRLGTDAEYRADVSRKIIERSARLFEDREAVLEIGNFFERAAEAALKTK